MSGISGKVKKNLLDLEYNKYLSYLNTSIIILFTYLVSVAIVIITRQIDYKNVSQIMFLSVTSMLILSVISFLVIRYRSRIKNISLDIMKLKI
jgi:predicted neutral ceramidase superfamily lipid hydrolase